MITPGLSPMAAGQTVAATVAAVTLAFRKAALPDAAIEARHLVHGLLAGDDSDRKLPADMPLALALPPALPEPGLFLTRLNEAVAQRLDGWPVDRILGRRGFWTLDLALSPATLSPRPDTETLVSAAIALLRRREASAPAPRILDLGTGTGAILLAILSEWQQATGLGIDLSPEAVAMARHNATRAGLDARAMFRTGDWFGGLSERFDLIVSNPPYIPTGDLAGLAPEVRDHDPALALDGGPDGLAAYRAIAEGAGAHLAAGGHLVIEAGAGQADDIAAIFTAAGFAQVARHRDLGGHERALVFGAPA
jgi:release factor glutamine methyltransferase